MKAAAGRSQLESIASEAIESAISHGATDAECTLLEGDEVSVQVRMGELEHLKEAGSRAAGVRVLVGNRPGSAYTSDLTGEGVERMVRQALEIARISGEDPCAALPAAADLGSLSADLELYHDDVGELPTEEKIARARAAEQAALAADPRIGNSDGAFFGSNLGVRVFANSRGFLDAYRFSSCSLGVSPVARDGASMERDYWMTAARSAARLEPAEEVGRIAARRVLRRLGARTVATQRAPVVFEPRVARTLLDHIFDAVNGSAVYRNASFLAGKLGEKIASDHITVVDDGTLPGLFGTSPWDDEGVPSRRTVVIRNGVLESYLLNTYSGRRLGLRTTGNAARGVTGNARVGHGNFYVEPGNRSEREIVSGIRSGLYVTSLMGSGVNIVTGDYSRGAAGVWIENGEMAFPVSEVTIAGTLQQILMDIEIVGSDLEFRGSLASPTLLVREMTISGR
jgi:PmbA protein